MKVPSTISQNGEGPRQAFLVWRSPPDSPLCLHANVLNLDGGCESHTMHVLQCPCVVAQP